MKLHTFLLALVLAPGVASLPCTSSAQEKKSGGDEKPEKKRKKGEGKKKKEANEEGKKPGEGALPPEFEAWMKVAAPGEAHKALEPMVGDWETHSKFIMSPEAPAMESKGTCKRTMILGGRFLQEELTGDFMGMPFQSLGILGYDNMKQKYVGSWADTMSTMILNTTGTSEAGGKKIIQHGEYDDPMTKSKKKLRMVLAIEGKDKHVMEWFETGPDGKESRMGEVVFTRKK